MATKFEQIIIKAPFILTKGFVLGYRHSKPEGFKYFFNRKAGIKRETVAGHVKDFFDMNQYSYLCIEAGVAEDFVRALKEVEGYGLSLEERSTIIGAEFRFSLEVFNEEHGAVCKEIFENKSPEVELKNFSPEEEKSKKGKIRTKGSSHAYSYKGRGSASGAFEGVMDLYLETKKSAISEFVLCNEIVLKKKK